MKLVNLSPPLVRLVTPVRHTQPHLAIPQRWESLLIAPQADNPESGNQWVSCQPHRNETNEDYRGWTQNCLPWPGSLGSGCWCWTSWYQSSPTGDKIAWRNRTGSVWPKCYLATCHKSVSGISQVFTCLGLPNQELRLAIDRQSSQHQHQETWLGMLRLGSASLLPVWP